MAGRDAAVIDLGVTTVWIDTQTFFVLKAVVRPTNGGRAALTQEVTHVRYDVALPASLFTYTAPPGVRAIGAGVATAGSPRTKP